MRLITRFKIFRLRIVDSYYYRVYKKKYHPIVWLNFITLLEGLIKSILYSFLFFIPLTLTYIYVLCKMIWVTTKKFCLFIANLYFIFTYKYVYRYLGPYHRRLSKTLVYCIYRSILTVIFIPIYLIFPLVFATLIGAWDAIMFCCIGGIKYRAIYMYTHLLKFFFVRNRIYWRIYRRTSLIQFLWQVSLYKVILVVWFDLPYRVWCYFLKITWGYMTWRIPELFLDYGHWGRHLIYRIGRRYYIRKFQIPKLKFIAKVVRFLRSIGLGFVYYIYLVVKDLFKLFLIWFFFWYSFYFLHINADEIGPWWDPWSIPSFCMFFTIYQFYYWYYVGGARWPCIRAFLDDNEEVFWAVLLSSWCQAQYMNPESWNVASSGLLPKLFGFWL